MWRAGFSEDSPLASLGGSTAKKVPSLGMQPRQLCTLRKEQKKKIVWRRNLFNGKYVFTILSFIVFNRAHPFNSLQK